MTMATEKEVKIINGTEITFYPNSHQYRINGKIIPSVTTVLGLIDKSRPLLIWAENLCREYLKDYAGKTLTEDVIEMAVKQYSQKRDDAADSGKQVHSWIESFINAVMNKTPIPQVTSTQDEVVNGINGFIDWYDSNEVEFLESERIVYSKKYNYVGTFDALAKVNKELTIIDFKTGKAIYPEFWLQLSAYHTAYNEEDLDYPNNLIHKYTILHFNKEDGTFETVSRHWTEIDFTHFEHLLGLRKFLAEHK